MNTSNPRDNFDDIVRYKERWQLMAPGDEEFFSRYRPIQLVIYYSGKFPVAYTKKCDRFVSVPIDGSVPAYSGDLSFAGFSSNNRVLITYDTDNACMTHRVDDTHMEDNSLLTCAPWDFDNHVVATRDGFLAMALPSPDFIKVWKQSGDSYVEQKMTFRTSAPSSRPTLVAVSKAAEFIVLSDRGGFANLYKRRADNSLTLQAAITDWMADAQLTEFSPDGSYIAQVVGTTINVWMSYGDGNFSSMPITLDPGFLIQTIAFSPDGKYIAIASATSGQIYDDANPSNRPIAIYKIDKLSDGNFEVTPINTPSEIWIQIGNRPTVDRIGHIHFTPDSNFLLVLEYNSDDDINKAVLLKKQSELDFTYAPAINEIVAGNPPSAAAMMH